MPQNTWFSLAVDVLLLNVCLLGASALWASWVDLTLTQVVVVSSVFVIQNTMVHLYALNS